MWFFVSVISLDDTLFILSLPRSGSTFTHCIFESDDNSASIALYEHLSAGSKTMSTEGRKAFAHMIVDPVTDDKIGFNQIHAMTSVTKAEEEIFFMEMCCHTIIYSQCMPRLEDYRVNVFERDYTWMYEDLLYEMKMHCMEFPLKENQHLCMKCVSHFVNPFPMFNVLGTKAHGRFLFIHRNPLTQLKSVITGMKLIHGQFSHDVGFDDDEWLNENIIKINIIVLKNVIKARDEWIKEDPTRAKRICDVGFKEIVKDPVNTVKRIYEYFGIEFKEGFEKKIMEITDEKHPQKGVGVKKTTDEAIKFNEEDVLKRYQFYYDRFGQYLN